MSCQVVMPVSAAVYRKGIKVVQTERQKKHIHHIGIILKNLALRRSNLIRNRPPKCDNTCTTTKTPL